MTRLLQLSPMPVFTSPADLLPEILSTVEEHGSSKARDLLEDCDDRHVCWSFHASSSFLAQDFVYRSSAWIYQGKKTAKGMWKQYNETLLALRILDDIVSRASRLPSLADHKVKVSWVGSVGLYYAIVVLCNWEMSKPLQILLASQRRRILHQSSICI